MEATGTSLQHWAPRRIDGWECFFQLADKMHSWLVTTHLFLRQHCPLAWTPPCKVWAGGSRSVGYGPCSLGCSSEQGSCTCTGEARVAGDACLSLAVYIYWCFCVFLNRDCGYTVLKAKIGMLMQCLPSCAGWRGGNSSLGRLIVLVLPKSLVW